MLNDAVQLYGGVAEVPSRFIEYFRVFYEIISLQYTYESQGRLTLVTNNLYWISTGFSMCPYVH